MDILSRLIQVKKILKSTYYQFKGVFLKDKDYQVISRLERAPSYQNIPPSPDDKNTLSQYLRLRSKNMRRPNNDRYELIPVPKGKTVLDLGANLGFFGFAWSNELKKYVGVDNDLLCINASELLKNRRELSRLTFIKADVVDFMVKLKEQYDVCLFFSLYHHILLKAGKEKAHNLLKNISKHCKVMYFDMGQKNEQKDYPKRKWYIVLPDKDPEMFIAEEVLENSEFVKYKVLGETRVGKSRRILFRFEK